MSLIYKDLEVLLLLIISIVYLVICTIIQNSYGQVCYYSSWTNRLIFYIIQTTTHIINARPDITTQVTDSDNIIWPLAIGVAGEIFLLKQEVDSSKTNDTATVKTGQRLTRRLRTKLSKIRGRHFATQRHRAAALAARARRTLARVNATERWVNHVNVSHG